MTHQRIIVPLGSDIPMKLIVDDVLARKEPEQQPERKTDFELRKKHGDWMFPVERCSDDT